MKVDHMGYIHFVLLLYLKIAFSYEVKHYSILMPNVNPNRDELYLCTPVKIVPDKSYYIVGFDPKATMNTVHHMILFGCSRPGTMETHWDCGEMASDATSSNLQRANPCLAGSHVIYAWARDAKTLTLPEDVGFQVGNDTEIAYLVLQVHYAKKFPPDHIDNSGISLMYTEEPQSKLAGVILLATGGTIPGHSTVHMDSDCVIKEDKKIYPIAYRTHTHSLGKVVSGYQVRNIDGESKWTLLGKRDPLTPQMFYETFSKEPIIYGDFLAARCTMVSDRARETYVGPTNEDEMCNFYLLYYVEGGSKPLEKKYCITPGPPYHSWETFPEFNNIPEEDSSTL